MCTSSCDSNRSGIKPVTLHPGCGGALSEGLVQGVVGEALAAVPHPQVRGVGEAVAAPQPQVAVDRLGRRGPERHRATLPSLSLADDENALAEVHVGDLEV